LEGPQQGLSNVITITLDETAESYFEKRAAEDYEGIRKELTEILEQLEQTQVKTTNWEEELEVRGTLAEELVAIIDEVREQDAEVEQRLRDLGDVLPVTSFAALAPEVVDLADTDVTLARDHAGQVKLTDRPKQRAEHGKTSDMHLLSAIERTKKLIEDLDELWKKIQRISDLRDLASQQEEISDLLEELAQQPEENSQLPSELFEEQSALNEDIAETIEQNAQTLEELFQQQLETAQELAETAAELAEQQEQLADFTEQLQQEEPQDIREQLAEQILQQQQEIAEEAAALDEKV
ncbi:MAG: hypothetical protein QGH11_15030, partial [Pirellulaceae bacterium]|nr:hypothetical protein [Pirellulaceae bacterium]